MEGLGTVTRNTLPSHTYCVYASVLSLRGGGVLSARSRSGNLLVADLSSGQKSS